MRPILSKLRFDFVRSSRRSLFLSTIRPSFPRILLQSPPPLSLHLHGRWLLPSPLSQSRTQFSLQFSTEAPNETPKQTPEDALQAQYVEKLETEINAGNLPGITNILHEMKAKDLKVDNWLFNNVLLKLGKTGRISEMMSFLQYMAKFEHVNQVSHTFILFTMGRLGQLDKMHKYFLKILEECPEDVVLYTFNVVLDFYVKNEKIEKAIEVLKMFRARNMIPDKYTYTSLIQLIVKVKQQLQIREILDEILQQQIEVDAIIRNSLLRAVGSTSNVDQLIELFENFKRNDAVDMISYASIIDSLGHSRRTKEMMAYFAEMKAKGFEPNLRVYTILLRSITQSKANDYLQQVLKELESSHIEYDTFLLNTVIKGTSYCRDWDNFQKAVDTARKKRIWDEYTFKVIINGYGYFNKPEFLAPILQEMESSGFHPDDKIFANLVTAYLNCNRPYDALRVSMNIKPLTVRPLRAILFSISSVSSIDTQPVVKLLRDELASRPPDDLLTPGDLLYFDNFVKDVGPLLKQIQDAKVLLRNIARS